MKTKNVILLTLFLFFMQFVVLSRLNFEAPYAIFA